MLITRAAGWAMYICGVVSTGEVLDTGENGVAVHLEGEGLGRPPPRVGGVGFRLSVTALLNARFSTLTSANHFMARLAFLVTHNN